MTQAPRKKKPRTAAPKAPAPRKAPAPAAPPAPDPSVRLIKKYGNRRLYDTRKSAYVTLDDLTNLLAHGEEIQVVDSGTGEDVTKRVLTQMILQEEEETKENILPVQFLKKLLMNRDSGMKEYVQKYLTASFDTWLATQKTVGSQLQGMTTAAMDPRMLSQFFPWMAGMVPPQQPPQPAPPAPPPPSPPANPNARVADELGELRARLAELEKQYRKG